MEPHTLVAVGGTFMESGHSFIHLDRQADPATADPGSGEELLDYAYATPMVGGVAVVKLRTVDPTATGGSR